jgi:hypothetical protein
LRPVITTLPIPNFASVSASIFFNNSSCSRHAQTPKDHNKEKDHKENLLRSTKTLQKKSFSTKPTKLLPHFFATNKQTNKQQQSYSSSFPSFFLSFFLSFLPSFFRCALSLQLGGATKHKSISPQQQQQQQRENNLQTTQ